MPIWWRYPCPLRSPLPGKPPLSRSSIPPKDKDLRGRTSLVVCTINSNGQVSGGVCSTCYWSVWFAPSVDVHESTCSHSNFDITNVKTALSEHGCLLVCHLPQKQRKQLARVNFNNFKIDGLSIWSFYPSGDLNLAPSVPCHRFTNMSNLHFILKCYHKHIQSLKMTYVYICQRHQEPTTDMMGIDAPKMDGSVQPNSLLLPQEGETRARTGSFTM